MTAQTPAIDLTKYIEFRRFGSRPHVRGRRIPVAVVVAAARDNSDLSFGDLAIAYDLSEVEVLAALLYYEQHRTEIDAQEAALNAEG
jgi:uncharacterized protein (DUF433 family)